MKPEGGWIKLYRKIQTSDFWDEKPFSRAQAWIDILLSVNHEDNKVMFDGNLIEVKRGQKLTSIRKLCERWGWSNTKVVKFLTILSDEKMLLQKSDAKKTLLIVANYEFYQEREDEKTSLKRHRNDTETHKQECKELKKKDLYTPEFEKFYLEYPRPDDKGRSFSNWKKWLKEYSVDDLMKAMGNYKAKVAAKQIEKDYIKTSANFLGKDGYFKEYINYQSETGNTQSNRYMYGGPS